MQTQFKESFYIANIELRMKTTWLFNIQVYCNIYIMCATN